MVSEKFIRPRTHGMQHNDKLHSYNTRGFKVSEKYQKYPLSEFLAIPLL